MGIIKGREETLMYLVAEVKLGQLERWAPTECYDLVALDDEGNWKVLRSGLTYDDADHQLDVYSDLFPHAILDILPHSDNA